MTSYTRKLYDVHPAAARQIHRQELRDYRYGKLVTVASFATCSIAISPQAPEFGKRVMPPVLPAYECWSPGERSASGASTGKPKAIVRAADSFQARREYAAYHGLDVTDVCARSLPQR